MSKYSKQDILEFLVEEEFLFHENNEIEITKDTNLKDIEIDSLDLITISINCENQFGIIINDNQLQNLKTVGDYVNIIYKACKEIT